MSKIIRTLTRKGCVTIPYIMRVSLGINPGDLLSITPCEDGNSVIVAKENLCTACATKQVQESAPCAVTLSDFLNSLSPKQQRAALIHLSSMCFAPCKNSKTIKKGEVNGH